MPEMGAPRAFHDPRLKDVRMWSVRGFRDYLIFYQPMSDGIRLLRIIHAAQDYRRILGP